MQERLSRNRHSERKIYVITSAQAEGEVDKMRGQRKGGVHYNLLNGLEKYCKEYNAELMILTMNGKNASKEQRNKDRTDHNLASMLEGRLYNQNDIYFPYERNIKLNSNVTVSDIIVPPQNVDPATGRERFVQEETTLIYAHSKQRLKSIPCGNSKLPKLLITTGAITHPNYNEDNDKGDVAAKEHAYGAAVVEIIDNKYFNVRFMRAQKDGQFIDMGLKFNGNEKPKQTKVEALVLGDIHLGDHDSNTMQANYEMIDFFKPRRLFLHDFLNGHSVNPHERGNLLTRVSEYEKGRLSIEIELKNAYAELIKISKAVGKKNEINVVASNHCFFLDRYLEGGYFINEPWNTRLALKLAPAVIEGKDPVEIGIRMMGKVPSNVHFLKLKEDDKIWGWQLASHGHKGISGAKGSIKSRENRNGKSITAHTHAPEILRNTVIVGTSTKLELPYTEGGANAWMAANAVLYEGGLVQLIPIINGKWKGYNR